MDIPQIPENAPEIEQALLLEKNRQMIRSGGDWFFWIAGLSLVNSLIAAFGGQWSFIIGLGVTQVIDGLAIVIIEEAEIVNGSIILATALFLNVLVALFVVLFGILARKHMGWAFIIGMILYAFDGLLFFLVQDWLSVGFHVFALYCIYAGYSALRKLKFLELQLSQKDVEPSPA